MIDVRIEAMDAIKKLKSKEMDVKTASEIRNLLSVVIDTAKTQVEFMKSLPSSIKEKMSEETIKAIAGAQPEEKKNGLPLFGNPYQAIEEINKEAR